MIYRKASASDLEGLRPFGEAAHASQTNGLRTTANSGERVQIVNRLNNDKRCAFTRADLEAMPLGMLKKLDASMNLVVNTTLRPYKGAK